MADETAVVGKAPFPPRRSPRNGRCIATAPGAAASSTYESCANSVRLLDYTLANPDTLTKYKTAATIAEKVLKEVSGASNTRTGASHAVG